MPQTPGPDPEAEDDSQAALRIRVVVLEPVDTKEPPFDRQISKPSTGAKPLQLRVSVTGATNLPSADLFSESDAYCVCRIPGKERSRIQTQVVPNSPNPQWEFEETLRGYVAGDELLFEIFDADWFGRDTLVAAAVLGGDRLDGSPFDGTLALVSEIQELGVLPLARRLKGRLGTALTPLTPSFRGRADLHDLTAYYFSSNVDAANTAIVHPTYVTQAGRLKLLHHPTSTNLDEDQDPEELPGDGPAPGASIRWDCEAGDRLQASRTLGPGLRTATTQECVDRRSSNQQGSLPTVMVEFDAVEVVAHEKEEEKVTVTIRRVGSVDGSLEVGWEVERNNVDPKYLSMLQPRNGYALFEPGMKSVDIELPVVDDPTWNVETVYSVQIVPDSFTPEDADVNVVLGRNSRISVYIVNADIFPANVPDTAPWAKHVVGFWRHNAAEIPSETLKGILLSLYVGVHAFLSAGVSKMIIDCGLEVSGTCTILGITFPNIGWQTIVCLAAAQVFLFALMHLRMRTFRLLRLQGKALRKLRANMVSTMLQLVFEARDAYDQGDIPKTIDTAVRKSIDQVWMNGFVLVAEAAVLLAEQVLAWNIVARMEDQFSAMLLGMALPLMMLSTAVILACSLKKRFQEHMRSADAEENWFAFVQMAESCCSVITGYKRGLNTVASVDKMHQVLNERAAKAMDGSDEVVWLLKWVFTAVEALVVIVAGLSMRGLDREGRLTVGSFVVLMDVVTQSGRSLVRSSLVLIEVSCGASAIRKCGMLLNKETFRRQRWERARCAEQRCGNARALESPALMLTDVTFRHKDIPGGRGMLAVPPLNLRIELGQLVCLPHGDSSLCSTSSVGVDTLFKILSGRLQPDGGCLAMPARWRVIYVPVTPLLFDGTLMYNLAYSWVAQGVNVEIPTECVWNLCRALGMSPYLIGREDLDVGTMGERLRFSDRLLVSLVRALMHDVDFLLVSSALDVLGEYRGSRVLRVLRHYVEARGMPSVPSTAHVPLNLRHRKLVLYTSKFPSLQGGDINHAKIAEPAPVVCV
mmetsp:Transcript_44686/g.127500  ORF Transcript_44686/g.127500 Transcript_44686/m.127500 type:complete len:1035 (+) Transcript_44686:141-3245(+)